MSASLITARVFRFNPEVDSAGRYEEYRVPADSPMSALEIARYIYRNIDASLAFRDHNCYIGVCSCCLMRVNGKEARACSVSVRPGESVCLEPSKAGPIVRDLVVVMR